MTTETVFVLYNKSVNKLKPETFNYLLQQVPSATQNKIARFRKWEDRQRSLLGNILLLKGLELLNKTAYSLNTLKFTEYNRPYFNNLIDFNVSHSGDYTMCAISETVRIGIDVEEIKDIPISDFNEQFSKKELDMMLGAPDNLKAFYTLWTQKEAFLKAIGTGLNVPLNTVLVYDNKITWKKETWYLHEIGLDSKHISHLSTNIPSPQIIVQKVDFS